MSENTLGSTAYWTAAVRAMEHERPDRLFADPWAAALAGETGKAWINTRTPDSVAPIVLRTRFFDDFLQRVTQQSGIRQVVLMAAGLDTRPIRLNWPEKTTFFELDQASLLVYKEQMLSAAGAVPGVERHAVSVDLTTTWKDALLLAGFNAQSSAIWLLEGFLFYLATADLTRILDEVSSLAAEGSWLGFDVINSEVLTSPWTRAWVEMQASQAAPWIGTLDDPVGFLAQRGWMAELSQAGAPDANHERWTLPVIPVTMPGMPHNWYVTAKKQHS